MKAARLLSRLQSIKELHPRTFNDMDVCVQVSGMRVGPTPVESISDIYTGFDWDDGRMILVPESLVGR